MRFRISRRGDDLLQSDATLQRRERQEDILGELLAGTEAEPCERRIVINDRAHGHIQFRHCRFAIPKQRIPGDCGWDFDNQRELSAGLDLQLVSHPAVDDDRIILGNAVTDGRHQAPEPLIHAVDLDAAGTGGGHDFARLAACRGQQAPLHHQRRGDSSICGVSILGVQLGLQLVRKILTDEAKPGQGMIDTTQAIEAELFETVADGVSHDQCAANDGRGDDHAERDREVHPPVEDDAAQE